MYNLCAIPLSDESTAFDYMHSMYNTYKQNNTDQLSSTPSDFEDTQANLGDYIRAVQHHILWLTYTIEILRYLRVRYARANFLPD
jgi:hypothetical protein